MMVMSELTGGVDGLGLLVFLMCSTYGRYIDPDQQGDSHVCRQKILGTQIKLHMYSNVLSFVRLCFISVGREQVQSCSLA